MKNQPSQDKTELLGVDDFLIVATPLRVNQSENEKKAREENKTFVVVRNKFVASYLEGALRIGVSEEDFKIFESAFKGKDYQDFVKFNDLPKSEMMKAYVNDAVSYAKLFHSPELQKHFIECVLQEFWVGVGEIREPLFYKLKAAFKEKMNEVLENQDTVEKGNPEFTQRQQVLALHYLFKVLDVNRLNTDQTNLAKFTHFITGKEMGNSPIKNSGAYKLWKNPLGKAGKNILRDLAIVKSQFEMLGLAKVIELIKKDMDSIEEEIKSP